MNLGVLGGSVPEQCKGSGSGVWIPTLKTSQEPRGVSEEEGI